MQWRFWTGGVVSKSVSGLIVIVYSACTIGLEFIQISDPHLQPALDRAQAILALPFLFFLPGYLVTCIIFKPDSLDSLRQVVFGLSISMVILVMAGLVINMMPDGLTTRNWMVVVSLLIGLGTIIRWIVDITRSNLEYRPINRIGWASVNWQVVIPLVLATIVIFAAVQLSRNAEGSQFKDGFTQLWLIPGEAETQEVTLGIANFEGYPVQYHVQLLQDDKAVGDWDDIYLANQEQWEVTVSIQSTSDKPIVALLYRVDNPTSIYRRAFLYNQSSG